MFRLAVIKHYKLIEALSIILGLVAWGLEWSSVKWWEREISLYQSEVELARSDYQHAYVIARILQENVLTRELIKNPTFDQTDTEQAWMRYQVRDSWLLDVSRAGRYFQNELRVLDFFQHQAGIPKTPAIEELRAKLRAHESEINLAINRDNYQSHINVIDERKLNASNAKKIKNDLEAMGPEMTRCISEVREALRSRADVVSFRYRMFFILAAIILASARFFEWRSHRKTRPVQSVLSKLTLYDHTYSNIEQSDSKPDSLESERRDDSEEIQRCLDIKSAPNPQSTVKLCKSDLGHGVAFVIIALAVTLGTLLKIKIQPKD